jgi:hypothetical protein
MGAGIGFSGSWLMKALLLSLVAAISLALPAWAETPAPNKSKSTPIIDIVAVVPGADHAARLKAKPDNVDLKPSRVLGSSGSLELDRRLASDNADQPRTAGPVPMVGTGMGLDSRWETLGNWNGGNAGSRPLSAVEARLDDQDPQGGFLAFKLPAGFLGDVIVGGGYTRNSTASSSATGPAPRGALAAVRAPESTQYDTAGRWGAFMAMPYQITNRMGVRPELSYSYGDNANLGSESGNEWVMGLRFTFGF